MAVADPILFTLVFFAVIAITTLVFGVWMFVMVIRAIGRGIAAIFRPNVPVTTLRKNDERCPREGCRAINPPSARFCRRCGQELLRGPGRWY